MSDVDGAAARRIHGPRARAALAGLASGLALLALAALVGLSPVLAGFGPDAPVSVVLTGGRLDGSGGLVPGDRITLDPIVVEAQGGAMLYVLRADVHGRADLIRQVHATARAVDGTVLYDGPLAGLSIGAGADGFPERRLAAGATERLSVTIALSLDAGNEVQGASLAITWRADAVADAVAAVGSLAPTDQP